MNARTTIVTSARTLACLLLAGTLGSARTDEFPAVRVAETAKMVFHQAPDLAALLEQVGSSRIVKLRAFVADDAQADDLREHVREAFEARAEPLPAITVVLVGGLPDEAAVWWESIAERADPVSPHGFAFISGQPASSPGPETPLAPELAKESVAALDRCLEASEVERDDVVRVTCLMSSLADLEGVQRVVEDAFSQAVFTYVQLEETPTRAVIECEAVAHLRSAPSQALLMVQPPGLEASPNYSHVALVGTSQVALTGAHVATRPDQRRAREAFEALQTSLEEAGASIRRVAMSNLYPSSPKAADVINRTRFDFYDQENPPGSTLMIYEGLPDDGFFAVDVVAPIE